MLNLLIIKNLKMSKKLKLIISFLLLSVLVTNCAKVREGLTNSKKSNNAEEFLIDKNNPLVLPPDYSTLPTPSSETIEEVNEQEFDLQKILKKEQGQKNNKSKKKNSNSLENSILEKIKTN